MAFIGVVAVFSMLPYGKLQAQTGGAANCNGNGAGGGVYGRKWECSYFTNSPVTCNFMTGCGLSWVFVPNGKTQYYGITPDWQTNGVSYNSFVAGIQNRLFDTTSIVNQGRAAAIVDIMLGKNGPDFGGSSATGIAYAQANWNTWVNLVTAYASGNSPGYSVNFNVFLNYATIDHNDGMGFENYNNDINTCTAQTQCQPDIAFIAGGDSTPDWSIVFNFPGGHFIIKDKCANLSGDVSGLPQPPSPSTLSCGGVSESLVAIDPKSRFNATATINYNPPSGASPSSGDRMFVDVSGPGYTSNNIVASPAFDSSAGTATGTVNNIGPTNNTGTFTVRYGMTNRFGMPLISCNGPLVVADHPYFVIQGGDIVTGAGMTEVSPDDKAGVVSWNQGANSYAGAGVQYAAFALGYIQAFATGQGSGTPDLLAFANTGIGALPAEVFGGKLGSESTMPDYFAAHPSSPTQTPGTITSVSGTKVLYINGNETIDLSASGGNVPNGSHTTIYVNGNVTIASNIHFSGIYTLAGIPSFNIIAKGNIYIKPTVTELSGNYVAEPDVAPVTQVVSEGSIYTCTVAPFALAPGDSNLTVDVSSFYTTCDQHLDVYGAFVARTVELLRTYGTLYQTPAAPAETFHYTPDLWLATGSNATVPDTYNAITELPPVL